MESIVQYFGDEVARHPPEIIDCNEPLRGYHGTSSMSAKSILDTSVFALGNGRLGLGIYCFEGGQDAIDAAEIWAEEKSKQVDADGSPPAVLEVSVRLSKLIDLDSPKNRRFIYRMMPLVNTYLDKNFPTNGYLLKGPHYVGKVLRECMGHVHELGNFDAIRSHFTYRRNDPAQRGFVFFDPKQILGQKAVLGLASC